MLMNLYVKSVMKMLDKYFSTRLELSKKKLKSNIDFLKKNIGNNKEIIAVLKANAYGFGDIILSKEIIKHGITKIAVADFEEGLRLRKNNIKVPIMIMYPALRNLKPIIDSKLEPSIYSLEMLNKLIFHAKKHKKVVSFHLLYPVVSPGSVNVARRRRMIVRANWRCPHPFL